MTKIILRRGFTMRRLRSHCTQLKQAADGGLVLHQRMNGEDTVIEADQNIAEFLSRSLLYVARREQP